MTEEKEKKKLSEGKQEAKKASVPDEEEKEDDFLDKVTKIPSHIIDTFKEEVQKLTGWGEEKEKGELEEAVKEVVEEKKELVEGVEKEELPETVKEAKKKVDETEAEEEAKEEVIEKIKKPKELPPEEAQRSYAAKAEEEKAKQYGAADTYRDDIAAYKEKAYEAERKEAMYDEEKIVKKLEVPDATEELREEMLKRKGSVDKTYEKPGAVDVAKRWKRKYKPKKQGEVEQDYD